MNFLFRRKIEKTKNVHPRWLAMQAKLAGAKSVVDLGCGSNPIPQAKTGVDLYVEPKERNRGSGAVIDLENLKQRGIQFVNARIDGLLPFKDKEFDFAYSHHVFEHLEDPSAACREMMRIAKSGVIITPSYFAEIIFGRPYHRWLVMDRGNTLFFFRKRPFEYLPFGESPKLDQTGKNWTMDEKTNPFDMLLNDEDWYRGQDGRMPKLSNLLRHHWYGHSPLTEVVFLWENQFECKVIE
ncbi:MAG: class I SAM-dependent methyltransferase [Candidatus Omnitrophica bacterium]|nr:class I SAM-dependent methyltransferase [Candidatus Omnitrophota bacterium]